MFESTFFEHRASLICRAIWGSAKCQILSAMVVASALLFSQPLRAAEEGQSLADQVARAEAPRTYTMRYNNISASELIRYISKISGRNFVYSENDLNFQVTYVSDEPESIDTILNLFIEILRINKLEVHEDGETLLVTPEGSLTKSPRVVGDKMSTDRAEVGIITKVFSLKFANPTKIKATLSSLINSITIEELPDSRCLIVVDTTANVERIEALIRHLDTDDRDVVLDTYTAKHLNLSALRSLAQEITQPLINGEKQTIIPNPMTGSLFIVASPLAMKKTLQILEMIDVRSEKEASELEQLLQDSAHPDFHLHKLQFHAGDEIIDALKKIGQAIGESDSSDLKLAYTIDTLQWIETTNSLLFSGSAASMQKLKSLISLLDTPVKQVYIEMLIVDTSIANSLEFGVDYGAIWANRNSNFTYSLGKSQGQFQGFPTSTDAPSTPNVPAFLPGGSVLGGGVLGNRLIHKGNIFLSLGALTRALQKDGDTHIIMNPRIVTEDNNPSKFFTGESVRVKSGIQQSTGNSGVIVSDFTTQDIGSSITIQPTISGNQVVTLQIDQSYSSAANAASGDDDIKPISKTSTTNTRVHVPNKFFLIIGGMSQHSRENSTANIPCLGGLPLIGKVLGDNSRSDIKRNLLIFVRPHIIDSFDDARELLARSQDELRRDFHLPPDMSKKLNEQMERSELPALAN